MKKLLTLSEKTIDIIDETLTPENAENKGFIYVDNVFNPYSAMQDVFELAKAEGYVFGNPNQNDPTHFFGLYRQVTASKKSQ